MIRVEKLLLRKIDLEYFAHACAYVCQAYADNVTEFKGRVDEVHAMEDKKRGVTNE